MNFTFKWCLIFLLPFTLFSQEALWEEAVEHLKSNQFEEASKKFSEWISEKANSGIYSPEAHYNLFLAQMGLDAQGPAVAHLLRSIQLESNPLKALDSLNSLCDLQVSYGIKEGLCQSKTFTLSLLTGKNSTLIFSLLAGWMFLLGIYFHFKKNTSLKKLSWAGSLLFVLLTTVFTLSQTRNQSLAVLVGEEKNIPVFRTLGGKEEDKLVELAPGTLLEFTGETKEAERHISQPIAGWIKEENLRFIDEKLSQTPLL